MRRPGRQRSSSGETRQLLAERGQTGKEPSRATTFRLFSRLSAGRHTAGSAATRRGLAGRPQRMFSQAYPAAPGVPGLRRAGQQRRRRRLPPAPLMPVTPQPPHVCSQHRIDRPRPPELPARLATGPGRRPEHLRVPCRDLVIRPHVHHYAAAIGPPREESGACRRSRPSASCQCSQNGWEAFACPSLPGIFLV